MRRWLVLRYWLLPEPIAKITEAGDTFRKGIAVPHNHLLPRRSALPGRVHHGGHWECWKCIGISGKDGVVLVGERKVTSKLLQTNTSAEKMYKIDDHVACVVAGIMSDANILINTARVQAQRYAFAYQGPMPVEQLVQSLGDTKQGYTQFGGLRPFGVSFLFAGWDKNFGFQLYMSDPSGNYGGWKATAIGANNQAAQSMLKQDYKDNITREEAVQLALTVLSKTMDSTSLRSEKLELAEVFLTPSGKVECQLHSPESLDKLLVKSGLTQPAAEAS
ncbi:hypothetical protein Cgig2_027989 [Carnegiea gigantea]|uniref:Proteasome subunit alpha type 4 n=1 Tax=Carnegiea gigantea TaxID=171969 RepID=A0A9Q1JJD0_9CARY|nr:hypothetical protein Cgig2_027989 [Carnegiea gigantea]